LVDSVSQCRYLLVVSKRGSNTLSESVFELVQPRRRELLDALCRFSNCPRVVLLLQGATRLRKFDEAAEEGSQVRCG